MFRGDLHLSRSGAVTLWLAMFTVHSYNQRFSISTDRAVVASEIGLRLASVRSSSGRSWRSGPAGVVVVHLNRAE